MQRYEHSVSTGEPVFWEERKVLMLAMAMQESNHMDIAQRDAHKDDETDRSQNCTIFNLSVVSVLLAAVLPWCAREGQDLQGELAANS